MRIRSAALPAIALAGLLALGGCAATGGDTTDDMPGMGHGSDDAGAADVNAADVMFAQMMIPHHEQAVEMSDILLAKEDVDPEVAELAEEIRAAQQPEIDLMTEWLDEWDAPMAGMDGMEGMDHGAHGGMSGMMSEEDMAALEDAAGPEASTLFLEQMIEHHEGAIDMAEAEIDDGENADAIALAETIVETQTAEIERMRELLAR